MTPVPILRPYQLDVLARLDAAVAAGRRRVLLVAPTGSGKTVLAGAIAKGATQSGQSVLILAHRRELIGQASAKLYAAGVDHGLIQAGFPTRPGQTVQIASVQTLHARAVRSSKIEMPRAAVVVVDEAHHIPARSYQQIMDTYPEAVVIGLTATPCRGDGRGLGNAFQTLVECSSIAELIEDGFLVPTRVYAPTRPDLTGVQVARGDYVEKQLAERMDVPRLVGDIVSHWHRLAERRRTVVFATGVAHSVHLRDEFRRSGVWAEHLDGSTPAEERDAILARLAAGTVEVVINCAVLTEGWDEPTVSCLVLARPTKSLGLYRQMAGRVLRPSPGKVDALILDHAGAVFQHGFVEDPIEWTLAEDCRAENRKHAARTRQQRPTLTVCPECSAIRFEGQPCAGCGWKPVAKPRSVDVIDGELGKVNRIGSDRPPTHSPEDKRRFHQQLLWIAREKGYRPGWAAHKFKEKFGSWPADHFVEPLAPDEAMRSWVRSRQIAYAKAMGKARTA